MSKIQTEYDAPDTLRDPTDEDDDPPTLRSRREGLIQRRFDLPSRIPPTLRNSWWIFGTILLAGLVGVLSQARCSAVQPACAVVDVAHSACEYVTVEYVDEDGTVVQQRLPRSELRAAAMRARSGAK